jgi:hypothetical protein
MIDNLRLLPVQQDVGGKHDHTLIIELRTS